MTAKFKVCTDCNEVIEGERLVDPDGEPICKDCFDAAGYFVCENCEETYDMEDCRTSPDGNLWCDNCTDDRCTTCEGCDEVTWNDDITEITCNGFRQSNRYYCQHCVDNECISCEDCGDTVLHDDSYHVEGCRCTVCSACYDDNYFTCDDCGETYSNDDYSCDGMCCNCYEDNDGGCDYYPGHFDTDDNSFDRVGSERRYGIELETDICDNHTDFRGRSAFGAKEDCSVRGKEFYSAILKGDNGLNEVKKLTKFAHDNDWKIDRHCGYHLHLDMTDESDDSLYAIAYAYLATYDFWKQFVSENRSKNCYCEKAYHSCDDLVQNKSEGNSFYSIARRARRTWINFYAYTIHKTFEVRLHSGTLNRKKVCNWVKAHTRFADWASSVGYDKVVETFDGMTPADYESFIVSEVWKDESLGEYYAGRKAEVNTPAEEACTV